MDLEINRCKKCGGYPISASENGRELLRCRECGYTVDVCATKECERLVEPEMRRVTYVIPNKAAREAVEKWNAKEE